MDVPEVQEPVEDAAESMVFTQTECTMSCKLIQKIIYLLKKNHVQTNYFWKPMHLQVFKKKFLIEKNMNNTNHIWNKIVPLPSSAGLESIDQNKILSLIKKYFNKR